MRRAFANLLEQRSLVPLPMWANLLFVALWGAALGAFVVSASTARAFAIAAVSGTLFFAWVQWQFDAHAEWWPLFVPLALQLPVAVALAVLLNYAEVLRQRELVQVVLGHYVPQDVVRPAIGAERARIAGPTPAARRVSMHRRRELHDRRGGDGRTRASRSSMDDYYGSTFYRVS